MQYFTLPHLSYWTPIGLDSTWSPSPSPIRVESTQTSLLNNQNFTLPPLFLVGSYQVLEEYQDSWWIPGGFLVGMSTKG